MDKLNMNFIFLMHKNLYLIHVLLKYYYLIHVFGRVSYNTLNIRA